jgi:hypothetical protein
MHRNVSHRRANHERDDKVRAYVKCRRWKIVFCYDKSSCKGSDNLKLIQVRSVLMAFYCFRSFKKNASFAFFLFLFLLAFRPIFYENTQIFNNVAACAFIFSASSVSKQKLFSGDIVEKIFVFDYRRPQSKKEKKFLSQ